MRALEELGALTLNTCVNYQIVSQPIYGEHLAWGDTGTVIWANSVAGARSNFEAGPAALHAAVTGRVPRYGYHLDRAAPGDGPGAGAGHSRSRTQTGGPWAATSAGRWTTTGRCRCWCWRRPSTGAPPRTA